MRIMIIGDIATGKSTFSIALGKKLNIPVIHLDKISDSVGRDKREKIGEIIKNEISKKDWILDGNAFTKDKTLRIENTDILIVFNSNRFLTFIKHFIRFLKIRFTSHKRVGSDYGKLNLKYYVPYIFFKFPKRKKEAVLFAKSLNKKIYFIKNRKDARIVLEKII